MNLLPKLALCGWALLTLAACDRRIDSVQESPLLHSSPVSIFAASSMQPVLDELAMTFEAEHGTKMSISYASSSALAQQIRNGAPADIFISADPAWAATLEETGHVETRADFLGNSLVVIAPEKGADSIQQVADLGGDAVKHIAIGDPSSVPAGKYAKEALEALGLWERLGPKFVPAMDVRHALLYVERGDAEAGIVYATDAKSSASVRVVATLDAHLKAPVRYALVLVKRDERSANAQEAFSFLLSEPCLKSFEAAGFTRVSAPANPAAPHE